MDWEEAWRILYKAMIIAFVITLIIFTANYCFKQTNISKLNTKIEQLEKINNLLNKRQDITTTTFVKEDVTTTSVVKDDVYVDILEEYFTAQKTYIELLTGILDNNYIGYPEFAYETLLKENVE